MKNLIYIFVIATLSASPLYSQEEYQSTLYHLNGLEYQGQLIELGDELVTFEIFVYGRLLTSKVHYKDIIKIIRSDGWILYENPDSEQMLARKTLSAEEKFKEKNSVSVKQMKQLADLTSAMESIKKRLKKSKKMKLTTLDNELYEGNLMYVEDSSLVMCKEEGCYYWEANSELRQEFRFSEIMEIEILRKSKIKRAMIYGFLFGVFMGGFTDCFDCDNRGELIVVSGVAMSIYFAGMVKVIQSVSGSGNQDENRYEIFGNFRTFTAASLRLIPKAIYPAGLPKAD